MTAYNPTDAIFFGFRIVKRDPILIVVLSAIWAALSVASILLIVEEMAEFLAVMQPLQTDPDPDPALVWGAMRDFFGSPTLLLLMLLSLLVGLIVQGAILRSIVLDRRGGWILGLQLGADELRLFVVNLIVWLLVTLLYIALVCIAVVVGGVLGALNTALGGLFAVIVIIGGLLGLVLVAVRFCAAAAMTVGEGKLIVFGSWRLTKGRVWGLLGAHVVLAFLLIVVGLVVFVLTSLVAPEAVGVSQGMTPLTLAEDMKAAFTSPGYLFVTAVNGAVNLVMTAAWCGVGAYAYRTLGGAAGYPNAVPPADNPPPLVS